jgi:hypothetical protein
MKKYDVMIPLGTGSQWQDKELRYTLRAIEENLKGFRNIIIVGQCPDWLQNVIHIPADDPLQSNADGNITLKTLKVCEREDVTDDFLFMNDDHVITQPINIEDIPDYYKQPFEDYQKEYWNPSLHRTRVYRTWQALKNGGHSTINFELHVPNFINKKKYLEILPRFPFDEGIGLCPKSLYGNLATVKKNRIKAKDPTIFVKKDKEQIRDLFEKGKIPHVAYNDTGLNTALKYYLYKAFPKKSSFEKYDLAPDPQIRILEYLKQKNPNYQAGVALYNQYGKNKNIKKLLQKGETPRTREKLMWKLQMLAEAE